MLIVAPAEGFNSLVSLEDALRYMADFGHLWVTDEAAQEVALRRGTQYLLANYSLRADVLDPVAANLQAACCEAALRTGTCELFADFDGRTVIEQTVDVITTKWADAGQGGQKRFGVIDALLRGLTAGGSNGIKLVRG